MLGVLRDLAGPGATRLAPRERLGLLRGGWATRWRTGPSLGGRLAYHYLPRPVPARYREWAGDDIAGRWYAVRRTLWLFSPFCLMLLVTVLKGQPLTSVPWPWQIWAIVLAISVVEDVFPHRITAPRANAVRLHLRPGPDEPLVPGGLAPSWRPRPRLSARTGAPQLVGVLVMGIAAWTTAALRVRNGPAQVPNAGQANSYELVWAPWHPGAWLIVAVIAVVLGLVAALRAGRLTDRLLPGRPQQPSRELVTRAPGAILNVLLWGSLLVWEAWLEATGQWVAFVSPVAGVLALLALPGALLAWRTARRGPADLALLDLWRIGLLGSVPPVDEPLKDVVRLPIDPPTPLLG